MSNMLYNDYLINNHLFFSNLQKEIQNDISLDVIPNNYKVFVDDKSYWKFYDSGDYIPDQGWKIHISTNINEYISTLKNVAEVLFKYNISFKHLKSSALIYKTNSKNASRASSGKFITLYPKSDENFLFLLEELSKKLKYSKKGPYILSDKRWKNTNVYYRYGGFKQIYNKSGELCIKDDNGNWVIDERKPYYQVPEFKIDFDNYLNELNVFQHKKSTTNLQNYEIIEAFSFSNSGGVYFAKRKSDKKKVIIKEARPYTGFDGKYRTAFERQNIEYEALNNLHSVDGIVNVIERFNAWEHKFIVEEFIEGVDLHTWLSRSFPFFKNQSTKEFTSKVVLIFRQLIKIIEDMHQKSVSMGDLQPANIMIDENLKVTLIDFETAAQPNEKAKVGMATPAFSNNRINNNAERDWYAVKKIFRFSILPTYTTTETMDYLNTNHEQWITKNYDAQILNIEYQINEKLSNSYHSKDNRKKSYDFNAIAKKINSGIEKNTLNNRVLFSGDIRQYEQDSGKYNLLSGSSGVVWAYFKRNNVITKEMKKWIEEYLLKDMWDMSEDGLFSGKVGIVVLLYELGYITEALDLLDTINIKESRDISLRSGLSGVGIAMLSLYIETKENKFLNKSIEIASYLEENLTNNIKLEIKDWSAIPHGVLDGWSGASLYFTLLYKYLKKEKYLFLSRQMIDKDLNNCQEDFQVLQLNDGKRLLPYLAGGSIGVGLAITFYNSVTQKNKYDEKLINSILNLSNTRVTLNGGLFDGAGGFLLLHPMAKKSKVINKQNTIEKNLLDLINLFIVDQNDYILYPGQFSFRFSFDLFSGSSGILTALNCIELENPLLWIPAIKNQKVFQY
ncbi:hypothetical protein BUY18_11165 [Staphylococcus cohnii]|uniref:class III lanthionine synthetase LanKC n=1 Tax=Staphylococcus ureilyticus TaxID=94138 RepID=UPI000D1C7CD0|nr:class III lanthionine synthetase LanKC [Staphylococcus ureilyticus]MBM9448525.1 class III lanthionine synthetase LanKC [Staphylococcus ureilyticus]PTF44898.1 hypothetical protein BUY18_11165 [Staphylococcus cohnii]